MIAVDLMNDWLFPLPAQSGGPGNMAATTKVVVIFVVRDCTETVV